MCCIFMYLLWVFDFFKGLMCLSRRGPQICGCACDAQLSYVWNRLEQEAFDHQADMGYLARRPCFAWSSYPNSRVARRWSQSEDIPAESSEASEADTDRSKVVPTLIPRSMVS